MAESSPENTAETTQTEPPAEDPADSGPAAPSRLRRRAGAAARAVWIRWPRLAAATGGGVALCLSFPPVGWWYSAFVAFGLFGWVLTRRSTTRAGGFGYGFLFGLAFYVPLLPWISGFVGAVPWLALAALEALFPALFGLLAVVVRGLPGWPVWFATLWVAQEWAKSSFPFGGFPWGVVAYGQTDGPLLALAHLGGAALVSLAVALIAFCALALVLEVIAGAQRSRTASPQRRPAVVLPGAVISAVLLATALVWPQVRQSGAGATDEAPTTVAVVQGNVPRLGLDFNSQRRAVLDNHVRETRRLAEDVAAGRVPQPAFVIWPENASDIDPLVNDDAAQQISAAAEAVHAPILVGTVLRAPGYTPENPVATNSVIVWNPQTGPADRHDKQIVQPFGEYLPWRSFFSLLSPYAARAGYFVPVDGTGVVEAAGVPVGVTTCWEVIFDRAARESVLNGAQLLAVPSNNATFDQTMSEQQLAFGKLRAVEHDRYTLVAGTTGISAVIAPDGRELARTGWFEPAYLEAHVRLKNGLTPATRWAPLLEGALVIVAVASVLVAMLQNGKFVSRRFRRPGGAGTAEEGAI